MSMDFSAILLLAFLACVGVLAIETLVLKPRRSIGAGGANAQMPWFVEQARSFALVLFLVVLLRSFVIEPYRIPSASMMPGLVDGDFIIVNKFAYGLRLPLLNTKVLSLGTPKRGDVVVFRLPSDPSIDYIKRLIGLPGDHVVVRDNRVYVNDALEPLTITGVYNEGYGFSGAALGTERFGAREHTVMFAPNLSPTDFDAVVPAGHYFFMGDNRNDSQDSRYPQVGFVPDANLVGHAMRIWLNFRLFDWPRWQRIGTKIT
jgi:signal peptidase I